MREPTDRGAPIEIEDFERRLRNQEARRASLGDPLRELARLMQEQETDDSSRRYAQIFDDHHGAAEEPEQASDTHHARHEALSGHASEEDFPSHATARDSAERFHEEDLPPPLRGSFAQEEDFYAEDFRQAEEHALTPVAHTADYGASAHERADEYYAEDHARYEDFPADSDAGLESAEAEEGRRGFRVKPWHAVALAALVGALGVGWGIARIKGVAGSREIATIAAPAGPTKVAPAADASQSVKEDATVLDRGVETTVRNVVPHQEAPVEPVVEPQREASAEAFRRVKTVAIREDNGVNPATAPAAVERAANDAAAAPPAASTTTPQNAVPPATTAQKPAPKKKVAVAPAEPVKPAPAEEPSERAAEPAPAGSSSIQFGTAINESEARAAANKFGQKYGSHLGGRRPTWSVVEKGDKTFYRLRVGGLSKGAATSLCKTVKSDGGDCFVPGN